MSSPTDLRGKVEALFIPFSDRADGEDIAECRSAIVALILSEKAEAWDAGYAPQPTTLHGKRNPNPYRRTP